MPGRAPRPWHSVRMTPGRYCVTLTAAGRPVAHGWWASEETARGKFRAWVGTYGRPGARVTLTDEETGEALTEWPARG